MSAPSSRPRSRPSNQRSSKSASLAGYSASLGYRRLLCDERSVFSGTPGSLVRSLRRRQRAPKRTNVLMQGLSIRRLKGAIRRHRPRIQECLLVVALMAVAALVAYEYELFPNSLGVPRQEHVIDPHEIIALAGLLCVCLLVLAWRFLMSQRREMALRIEAEHRLRELTHESVQNGSLSKPAGALSANLFFGLPDPR